MKELTPEVVNDLIRRYRDQAIEKAQGPANPYSDDPSRWDYGMKTVETEDDLYGFMHELSTLIEWYQFKATTGDYAGADETAEKLCKNKDIKYIKDSTEFCELCRGILSAKSEAAGITLDFLEKEYPTVLRKHGHQMDDHKPAAAAVVVQPPVDEGLLLSEVIEAYAVEKKRGWTEKSGGEIAADSLGLFKEIVGDVPIQSIDRKRVSGFKHILVRLPPNRNKAKKYRDKSIPELLEMESEIEKVFAPRTVNKHLSRVGTFFKYANVNGYYKDNNPATGMEIPLDPDADDKRAPYSIKDLTNIFNVDGYAKDNFSSSYMFWTPVIALFHGMRQAEIAQLHLSDIRRVKDGTWIFDVNDLQDKKVKNPSSKRLVPIHPFLMNELKILKLRRKLLKEANDRLFPEIKPTRDGYGAPVSKWYNERFKHKITLESDPTDRWKDFHSFRKTFITHVAHRDVPDKKIKRVIGHSTGSDVLNRVYIDKFKGKQLLDDVIAKIDFHKTIDLSHLKRSKFVIK